jgi:hypothetical protein
MEENAYDILMEDHFLSDSYVFPAGDLLINWSELLILTPFWSVDLFYQSFLEDIRYYPVEFEYKFKEVWGELTIPGEWLMNIQVYRILLAPWTWNSNLSWGEKNRNYFRGVKSKLIKQEVPISSCKDLQRFANSFKR